MNGIALDDNEDKTIQYDVLGIRHGTSSQLSGGY